MPLRSCPAPGPAVHALSLADATTAWPPQGFDLPPPPPDVVPLPPSPHPVPPPEPAPPEVNEPPAPLEHAPVRDPATPGARSSGVAVP